jgi:hypothetical protein
MLMDYCQLILDAVQSLFKTLTDVGAKDEEPILSLLICIALR